MAAKNLRPDGMYEDGSNPESVEPVPALEWRSLDDMKDVVVHGIRASPAVSKLVTFLCFYNVPFKLKPGLNKKGSKYYKKMPVMDVAGRQVNDTFIQIKNLTKAFGGSCDWNEEWQTRITYEYQLSTVYLMDFAEFRQMVTTPNSDFPLPSCCLCLVKQIRPGALKKMKALFDDPNTIEKLVDLTEFCKEFAAAMGSKPYFHGDEPGNVDISFYGVNARYVFSKNDFILNPLDVAGLMPWLERMMQCMPLDNIFFKV
ncbi:unnamed protein product [Polarella glacialis]|uniref:GST C-terminal domain-containing protein n=1 Tax=Polarella glacialis TaxID=89957 RepID=A0A813G9Z2_POLGL|nr:unnamed protein product [Polarella glacialis]